MPLLLSFNIIVCFSPARRCFVIFRSCEGSFFFYLLYRQTAYDDSKMQGRILLEIIRECSTDYITVLLGFWRNQTHIVWYLLKILVKTIPQPWQWRPVNCSEISHRKLMSQEMMREKRKSIFQLSLSSLRPIMKSINLSTEAGYMCGNMI